MLSRPTVFLPLALGILIVLLCGFAVWPEAAAAKKAPIGQGSCIGEQACEGLTGSVGDNSCNGDSACLEQQRRDRRQLLQRLRHLRGQQRRDWRRFL